MFSFGVLLMTLIYVYVAVQGRYSSYFLLFCTFPMHCCILGQWNESDIEKHVCMFALSVLLMTLFYDYDAVY